VALHLGDGAILVGTQIPVCGLSSLPAFFWGVGGGSQAKTVIWTTTTPCPNVTTSMGRTDAKVVAYNAKAKAALAAVVGAAGLVVDDLYTKVDSYCGHNYKSCDLQLPTNVHFTAKGCQFMAEDVVTSITAALDSQHQIPPFR